MRTLALTDDQVLRNSEALKAVHTSAEIEDMENVSLSEIAVTLPVPSVMVHVGVMKGDCLFMRIPWPMWDFVANESLALLNI